MKLNLLPQTVSKGRALRGWYVLSALLILGSCVLAALMVVSSTQALAAATKSAQDQEQGAADAVATSKQADNIIASAQDLIRDANLSQAMISHNDVYPKLYGDIKPYIPNFFRLTSEVAAPQDDKTSTITFQGTIGSYEQYADLMIALMRFPGAVSVSRANYFYDPIQVPPLTPQDMYGQPRKQDAQPIPTDQLQKLVYYENQVHTGGYQGIGNFGAGDNVPKSAMPGESLITVVLTVTRDLQVPSAESTLANAGGGGGGAVAASAAGFGAPGGPGGPGGMGGPPGGFQGGAFPGGGPGGGAPPAGVPGAAGAARGRTSGGD